MSHAETALDLRAQADKLVAQALRTRSPKFRVPLLVEAAALRIQAARLEGLAEFGGALGGLDAEGWVPA